MLDRDGIGQVAARSPAREGSPAASATPLSSQAFVPVYEKVPLSCVPWPTAYLAAAAIERTGAADFIYLIQDFEPGFYAWSTNYALAEATYSMPMRAIFNDRLVHAHYVAGGIGRFKDPAASAAMSIAFEPAVDATLFRPRRRTGPRRLLFYARPSKPRNLYPLGLRALRSAAAGGTFRGWELQSIGEPIGVQNLGDDAVLRPTPWLDVHGYAELLGKSDVLLSLMLSPHPSYPPLEMAASGGVVVTNTFALKTAEELARCLVAYPGGRARGRRTRRGAAGGRRHPA